MISWCRLIDEEKRAITCSADLGYVDRICNRDLLGVNKVAVYRHGYRYACHMCVCVCVFYGGEGMYIGVF